MKTGVILYLVGDNPMGESADVGKEIKKLAPETERVEVVAKDEGHFDISEAWWALTVKGMRRIICMVGEITETGTLQMKNRTLRLCG